MCLHPELISPVPEITAKVAKAAFTKGNKYIMLAKFGDLELLKSRGKARTDSTQILAVVQELTKLEHLEETLKSALNTLAKVAPTWLERIVTIDWYERYGQKIEYSSLLWSAFRDRLNRSIFEFANSISILSQPLYLL
ncbi:MAG: hypothetical protein RLZZ135_2456 [Cyanobacteriota bacterium]|jgi:hypothetical protein